MMNNSWIFDSGIVVDDIFCIIIYSTSGRDFYFDENSHSQDELQALEADLNVLNKHEGIKGQYGKIIVSISEVDSYIIEYQ